MKRVTLTAAVLAMAAMMSRTATAQRNGPPTLVNNDAATADAFWTADRLAQAKPMDLPAAAVAWSSELESPPSLHVRAHGAAPTLHIGANSALLFTPGQQGEAEPEMFGSSGLRFSSSRLVTDAVASLGGEFRYPYSMTGKLFFNIGSSLYVCSATVQRVGVITTAGHCVSDGNGHFYSNWQFIPATRVGSAPFGTWVWRQVVTTATWHFGGGGVPNAQDVAVIALVPNSNGRLIGNITGYAGFDIPDLYSGQHLTTIGYPCNLDNCAKDHRNDAQAVSGSNNTDIVGSDMGGGASGGGWLVNYGEYAAVGEPPSGASDPIGNALVAVTSYGPVPSTPLYLGASILDGRYVQCTPLNTCAPSPSAILNYLCVHNPGFC
jgi:V8-like Glu-specific endopeptidase